MNLLISNKYLRKNINLAIFVTFTLSFTFVPFTKSLNPRTNALVTRRTSANDMAKASRQTVYHSVHKLLPVRESMSIYEYLNEICKNCDYSRQFLQLNALLTLLLPMALMICAFLSSFRRITKHVSIIAISLGGHAPPVVLS